MEIVKRSVGIHDGSFHADEVTACAFLILYDLIDRDKIHRTRDHTTLEKCEYICDVGGEYDPKKKRFDHHQVEYEGTLSSAGMILLYLKDQGLMSPNLYEYLNRNLVIGIDEVDNGISRFDFGYCTFSDVVSNFLPIEYDIDSKVRKSTFYEALDFVLKQLDQFQKRFFYLQNCRDKVKKAMDEGKKTLFFEESMPWMENFFDLGGENHPALFVVMPTISHWKLRGIPPSWEKRMKVRVPLPEEWAGLHEEDLRKASGIEGAIFCHKGRFISIWETKEDVLKALAYVLKKS